MGGICSRKRDQQVIEIGVPRGVSGRYYKSSFSKWLATALSHPVVNCQPGGSCPSLLELCINQIREVHALCDVCTCKIARVDLA